MGVVKGKLDYRLPLQTIFINYMKALSSAIAFSSDNTNFKKAMFYIRNL